VNPWLELPQAVAHLAFTVGGSVLSGLAELTRPTPEPPVLLWPGWSWPDNGEPIMLPGNDPAWNLAIAQITAEWREGS
jgi:hypothetical protein